MDELTKDALLRATKLAVECVEIPELGGRVHVRELTAAERDTWEDACFRERRDAGGIPNLRAKLVVMCACDEQGALLFRPADAEALGRTSAVVVERIFDVALRLNRMRAKDVEELEKN